MFFSRARATALEHEERPVEVPVVPAQVLSVVKSVDAAPAEAEATIAGSVATVGYAMFALLRRGDVADVPSFDEFLDRAGGQLPPPAVDAPAVEDGVFGAAQVDHHFAAVARPGAITDPVPPAPAAPLDPVPASLHDGRTGHPPQDAPGVPTPGRGEPAAARAAWSVAPAVELGAIEPATEAAHRPSTVLDPAGFAPPPVDESVAAALSPAPAPRTSNTLAMLQEISFLDE